MTDGVLEGPVCASCGVPTLNVYLCDDLLHVLCAACGQAGRLDAARCRACRGERPEPTLAVDDATARLRIGGARSSADDIKNQFEAAVPTRASAQLTRPNVRPTAT